MKRKWWWGCEKRVLVRCELGSTSFPGMPGFPGIPWRPSSPASPGSPGSPLKSVARQFSTPQVKIGKKKRIKPQQSRSLTLPPGLPLIPGSPWGRSIIYLIMYSWHSWYIQLDWEIHVTAAVNFMLVPFIILERCFSQCKFTLSPGSPFGPTTPGPPDAGEPCKKDKKPPLDRCQIWHTNSLPDCHHPVVAHSLSF